MRVAVLGLGAIGRLVSRDLERRAEVIGIDRTTAPLRPGEPQVDAAIVCAKTPGTAWAAGIVGRLLRPDGLALTVQNGLGNREALAAEVGSDRAALGALYAGAYLDGERLVQSGTPRLDVLRPAHGHAAGLLDELVAALRAAGWEIAIVDAVGPLLWRKLVANAAINPTTALLDIENGGLSAHPTGARLADALAEEAARVATAAGVPIAAEEARALWRTAAERTAANRSSMLEDVRAGRETEIDAICGGVVRCARRRGVAAPLCAAMVSLIGALRP